MPSLEELMQTTLKDYPLVLSDREAQCLIDAVSEHSNVITKLLSKSNYDDSKDPVQPLVPWR